MAIIPYFGYSRQDRRTYKNESLSASLVIKLLEFAGISKVITLDLHSKQLESVFNIPVVNINPTNIFFPFYKDEPDTVIVSPDIGGIPRTYNFSSLVGKGIAIINKIRSVNNECSMDKVIGNVQNKKCIIIDDIIDSGNTLCKAAGLLKKNGATNIDAYVTHPVLSGNAKEKIMYSEIDKIFVSDSIYHNLLPDKFSVVLTDKIIILEL